MMRLWLLLAVLVYPACAEQPDVILKQAVEAHRGGDIDKAVRLYKEFLKVRPNSLEAHSNLGAALARQGLYEDAISQYRDALKLSPANPGVALNLSLAYYKSGEINRAADELTKLNIASPGVPQVTMLLADCWLQMGEYTRVVDLLTPQYSEEKEDLATAYLLGTALIRDKQIVKGQRMLDRILKNGDSAEARLMMGTAKLSILDFAGALEELSRAVALNAKLPTVNSFYGQALMATGDTAGAQKAFRAELALNPNDYDSNLNLGSLLRQDHDFDNAVTLLERALRVRPGDLRARYQIANIQLAQGKVEAAERSLAGIIKEAPKFTEAHVSLATVYYRLKRKADGDRERAIVLQLNEEAQAAQPKGEIVGAAAKPQP